MRQLFGWWAAVDSNLLSSEGRRPTAGPEGASRFPCAHYMNPVVFTSHDPLGNTDLGANPSAWWLDQPVYQDASGQTINGSQVFPFNGGSPADVVAYWKDHGISMVQYYQPGDRFWTFQTIESGIPLVLAAVLLGFAVYWVVRRVT